MKFTTENSTYEVDVQESRIRRLGGNADPTPRQGADGEWKHFVLITPIEPGQRVFVDWDAGHGTLLSEVQEVSE